MYKEDVIEVLCDLVSTVGEKVFKNECEHDCFCGKNVPVFGDPVVHEAVIEFIEKAVDEKMQREGHLPNERSSVIPVWRVGQYVHISLIHGSFFLEGSGLIKGEYNRFCDALKAGMGLAKRVSKEGWK